MVRLGIEDVGKRLSCTVKTIGICNSLKYCWDFYASTYRAFKVFINFEVRYRSELENLGIEDVREAVRLSVPGFA